MADSVFPIHIVRRIVHMIHIVRIHRVPHVDQIHRVDRLVVVPAARPAVVDVEATRK